MTFTRPISQSLSPTYRPNANCINRRIHFRACFLRISLCLTYFFVLAIQLSICGFPAAAGAFSGEKASCLARQLTYISTDEFFRQAFFEKIYDFFRNIFRKFFPYTKTSRPYTIYSMRPRAHAYTARSEKQTTPPKKSGIVRKTICSRRTFCSCPSIF